MARLCGVAGLAALSVVATAQGGWPTHGGNAQHTNISPFAAQSLRKVLWSTPVDLNPQYSGSSLLMHYASPLVTANNTVIVTVKTGAVDGFKVEGRKAGNGDLVWTMHTDYSLPPHNWTPTCSPTIAPNNSLYTPAGGGTILRRVSADAKTSAVQRLAFYGIDLYNANTTTFNDNVKICTPIVNDSQGNLFFGFRVFGANPAGLESGLARISATGVGSWVPAKVLSGEDIGDRPAMACAPALSNDETVVYIATRGSASNVGFLCAANATSLTRINSVRLRTNVVENGQRVPAYVLDDSTSTPTVGPDGDVYYGAWYWNNFRGFMTHFDASLTVEEPFGAFGWDITPSIIPTSMIPSYDGPSPYLLLSKYNNYLEAGAGGLNEMAVLDPNVTELDPVSSTDVMKPVWTKLAPTPDPRGGFIEWCVNTTAIDPQTRSAIVNSEDGKVYRWNLAKNELTESVRLTDGLGEAYTSTIIGPDGLCYAMSNATLFVVWDNVQPSTMDVPETLNKGDQVAVSLSLNSRATGEGAHISLRSSHPSLVRVPASINIPRGEKTRTFKLTVGDVTTATDVTITAIRYGRSITRTLRVSGAGVRSLSTAASSLYAPSIAAAGGTTTGEVAVSGDIPDGASVQFSTSDGRVTVSPTSLPVSNANPSGSFNVQANGPVSSEFTATITARLGDSSRTVPIQVYPRPTLVGFTVNRTDAFESQSVGATFTLSVPAQASGETIALSVLGGEDAFNMPANVVVTAGLTEAKQSIGLKAIGTTAASRTLSATHRGITISRSILIRPITVVGFVIDPTSVFGGASSKGFITLNARAGSAFPLTIQVAVDGTRVTVPTEVVVPAGSDQASFNIVTDEVNGTLKRRITVSRNGTSASAVLTLKP